MSWRPPKHNSRSARDVEIGEDFDDMDDGAPQETGRYSQTALGDLAVAQARWWNSYLDMVLKLGLLFLYIAMAVFSTAFWVPLTLNAVVNAVYLFIFPFAFAAFAVVLVALSVIDAFTVGLHYRSIDSLGRYMIVSYRDRTFNLLLSSIALGLNLVAGLVWAIWFGRHSDLDTLSEFATFEQGVVTYYALCAIGAFLYVISPVCALVATYSNVRYEMGVHLLDNVMRITRGENLERIFERMPEK